MGGTTRRKLRKARQLAPSHCFGVTWTPSDRRLSDIPSSFLFVGGETRWKRAHGREIVETAHEHNLTVHIGRPDGEDGLPWAYKIGADSADTSTIDQNGYWHYLERLEAVTEDRSKGESHKKGTRQSQLVTDGGTTTK